MLAIGDIHVYVTDFALALRFWAEGLGLNIADRETSGAVSFALLEFPDGGPGLRLFGGAEPWPRGSQPEPGTRPTVRFDITTSDFDGTLSRLLDAGGEQVDTIESYNELRVVTIADPDGNLFELLEVPE